MLKNLEIRLFCIIFVQKFGSFFEKKQKYLHKCKKSSIFAPNLKRASKGQHKTSLKGR